jgi:hypothetical protein
MIDVLVAAERRRWRRHVEVVLGFLAIGFALTALAVARLHGDLDLDDELAAGIGEALLITALACAAVMLLWGHISGLWWRWRRA